jgi:hypothetical protein
MGDVVVWVVDLVACTNLFPQTSGSGNLRNEHCQTHLACYRTLSSLQCLNPIRLSVKPSASAVNNSRPSRSLVVTVQSLAGDEEIWVICHPHHSPGTALFSGSVLQTYLISGTLHVDVGGTSPYFSLGRQDLAARWFTTKRTSTSASGVTEDSERICALWPRSETFSCADQGRNSPKGYLCTRPRNGTTSWHRMRLSAA